ncbi:MAG: MFS transporter [Anaerolineales bacterium]|nr:MFS transporter [Anaerolineales bacterium]
MSTSVTLESNQKGNEKRYKKNTKWYILGLIVITNITLVAIPNMGMSVLAKEIAQDLGLSLVQVGIVWGVGSVPGIVTGLFAGAIGDKVGPKRILIVGSLLTGLVGAARGLAPNFVTMVVTAILLGALIPFIIMNGVKTIGLWFPSRQLGQANGLSCMGMAFGFLIGSMMSATLLSPLLGGWRQVMIFYGVIGAFLCVPWIFVPSSPRRQSAADEGNISIHKAITHVAGVKNIWLLGMTLFGVSGCIQGLLGYLPIYLRSIGWDALYADGALSAFHTASMIFVLPIAWRSDRLGSRKRILLIAGSMIIAGTGLLSVARGLTIWGAVIITGMVRDAFMAISLTMVIETEGIGPVYAGTASGLVVAISGVGSFLAPPLGNSFAEYNPAAPFTFWALLAFFGVICLSQVSKPNMLKPAS